MNSYPTRHTPPKKYIGKRIVEQALIGLLIAVVLLVVGITIHRKVINSDAYQERKALSQLNDSLERLRSAEDIDYVNVARRGEEDVNYYNVDASIFDGLVKAEDARITDPEVKNQIFLYGDSITVFYTDGTYDILLLSEEGHLYWTTSYRLECPALISWLEQHGS